MLTRKKSIQVGWREVTAGAIFALSLIWMVAGNVREYIGDAYYYWIIADNVYGDGLFDITILNFPETFRGCLFPIILGFFKHLFARFGCDHAAWWFCSAVMNTILFSVVLPMLFEYRIGSMKSFCRVLILYALFLLFWGELIRYPLSDHPAAFLMFLGIAILKWSVARQKDGEGKGKDHAVQDVIMLLIGGGVLYSAYNTRAAFLYGVIVSIVVYVVFSIRRKKSRVVCSVGFLLLGMLVAAIPQMKINRQYIGSFSPKVFTEQLYGYAYDLQKQQIFWGLQYSRYETFVGSEEQYPPGAVYFVDDVGKELIEREQLEVDSFSYGDLLRIFFRYPLDMCGIYIRHLISLMTPLYREVYIGDMFTHKEWMLSVSVLLWAVAVFAFMFLKEPHNKRKGIWMLPGIVPCLLQMFGAPELRFFLPVYILLYGFIVLEVDHAELVTAFCKNFIRNVVVFLFLYGLWIVVVSDILGANIEKTLLIHG